MQFGAGKETCPRMEPSIELPQAREPVLMAFVRSFRTTGRWPIRLEPLDEDRTGVAAEVVELDRRAREELGGDAPALDAAVAEWAAILLYRLCQCAVCRDLGEGTIRTAMEVPCPGAVGPSRAWSADLFLRHLPALAAWVRRQSHLDPLLSSFEALAREWPLSSVGMPGWQGGSLDGFAGHPALMRLYVDRVESAEDFLRLGDPRVDAVIRGDLRVHRELSPRLAARLMETLS